jgi:hypothetical protein
MAKVKKIQSPIIGIGDSLIVNNHLYQVTWFSKEPGDNSKAIRINLSGYNSGHIVVDNPSQLQYNEQLKAWRFQ